MRNTKVPPWCRANAQLNSAVLASPTCGVPVGDGQKRARTGRPGRCFRWCQSWLDHPSRPDAGPNASRSARRRPPHRPPAHRPAAHQRRAATGLVRVPMPSTVTETRLPGDHRADPGGVPVSSTSPGSKRHDAGDELDDLPDREDHVRGPAVLHDVAVQLGLHLEIRSGPARFRSTDPAGRTCRNPCPG